MSKIVRKLVCTANAANPMSVYSQAVVADRIVYVSGCLGLDKNSMKIVPGGITEQTEVALKNLSAILEAAGSGMDNVIKNTIFLKCYEDYDKINNVYKKFFTKDYPARSSFQVPRLPMDALIEIESIALVNN